MRDWHSESFWLSTLAEELSPRSELVGQNHADVVIVGAGYTGLWTAYYLLKNQPNLRVILCEAGISGIGASGRNGGWCMGMAEGVDTLLEDPKTREPGLRLTRALFETPNEIERVMDRHGIDGHFKKGGVLSLATLPSHEEELHARLSKYAEWGIEEEHYRWLPKSELNDRLRSPSATGALYSPHVAAVHPANLVRGLAEVVESRGANIFELSPVCEIEPGCVKTQHGQVHADWVVLATEGYTPSIPGRKRRLAPIHSMMVATEPLPESLWDDIGLSQRETFGGSERITTYGQRTADGRIAFGSRGLYYYGSKIREKFSDQDPLFEQVRLSLVSILPQLKDIKITHRWGGALGFSRNVQPAVGVDAQSRLAFAGGYMGEGVGASNLMGRILTDLLNERETPLTSLPWVAPDFPNWELEPFRWLGVTGVRTFLEVADRREASGKKANRLFEFLTNKFYS